MVTGNWRHRAAYILAITAAVVSACLMLAIAVLMALNDADYLRLAQWSVEKYAGYRMIVDGPFHVYRSAEPSVSAAGIRFEPAQKPGASARPKRRPATI